ncbi:OmpP1/FadL family transporter [Elizabethkingia bruuniana]|nr:hemin receptor [Elizabethkingia bruuniana]KGO10105.1 hemin receptor [Elizabethkingia miricola]OPB64622.1 hemin receptor [Elizabethkingia bruuniana]OPC26143.1 hemin receptor [Elizabethkingia bruuniana]OPC54812.1 hemin receptor [Elizabethkingia bruuniana]OPC66617.1 hemin receptor [Elizabethkingia bruuniana]
MHKKIVLLMSLPAALFLHAQDVSEIRNTATVYGNNMTQGSAKYMGMAGAMGAIGGDISAANVNPAGVGVYITGDFQGTLGINSYKNTSTLNNSSLSYKKNNTNLNQLGGVVSFPLYGSNWKFVNIGVSYLNQNLDDYTETPGNNKIAENITWTNQQGQQINDRTMYDGHGYNRTGHLTKTNLTVGGNYNNKIYVGMGLNFHTADLDQGDSYRVQYASDGKTTIYNKQYTPYTESSSGFSISAGIIGKVTEEFRLGASLESPTWWNMDRAYTQYSASQQDGPITSVDIYNERRDFRSPAKATFSAAVIPSKDFAFNVDYTIGISKPKYTTSSSVNDQLNNFLSDSYKSLSELKVGAEYRFEGFRLRAGYAFANNPFDNRTIATFNNDGTKADINYNNLYVGKRNTLGLGIGYDFRSFYIDAAYQNVKYDYNNEFFGGAYATNSNVASEGVINNNSIVSAVKNQQNNIFITLGYRF